MAPKLRNIKIRSLLIVAIFCFSITNPRIVSAHPELVSDPLPIAYSSDVFWDSREALKNYKSIDVPEEIKNVLGQPTQELAKQVHEYVTPVNGQFVRGKIFREFRYASSLEGQWKFLNGENVKQQREINRLKDPERIREAVRNWTGYKNNAFGSLEKLDVASVQRNINLITATYTTGAVVQFLLTVPPVEKFNGKLIVLLHGNSSSPDAAMRVGGKTDYTNAFGRVAYSKGYIVVVPYILSNGNWANAFENMGAVADGLTIHGYEMSKVEEAVKLALTRVESSHQVTDFHIYGISYGAYVATFVALLDQRFSVLCASGFVYDVMDTFYRPKLPFPTEPVRTNRILGLWNYVNNADLLAAVFPRKVVVEIGAYDVRPGAVDQIKQLKAAALEFEPSPLFVNFFLGYHETNPVPTLNWMLDY